MPIRLFLIAAILSIAGAARASEVDYRKLYASAAPSVVLIYGETNKEGSVGAGSIIRAEGVVLTNAHVVIDPATKQCFSSLRVFLKPAKLSGRDRDDLTRGYGAKCIAFDAGLDLALLRMVN